MGLCKCPKRKVTNQFCFEHRVNVCEHCMIKKHPKCVVQSYLQWLQDSDYNPNCLLCDQDLSEESCVRLNCYHVFHWVCLDRYARNLPADTAPAGYTCPACQDCIFPPENLVSPVADELKKLLSNVNWARAGLGLPLLEEKIEKRPTYNAIPSGPRPNPEGESLPGDSMSDGIQSVGMSSLNSGGNYQSSGIGLNVNEADASIIQFDGSSPTSRIQSRGLPTSPLLLGQDADDNKYKRRSALSFLSRWWRSTIGPTFRGKRLSSTQRQLVIALFIFFGFVSLMVILSHLGRRGYDDGDYIADPMLDPMNNPNIHVKEA